MRLAVARHRSESLVDRLCQLCVLVTDVNGAGVMFMDGELPRVSLSATTAVSTAIEELQFTLGEGPCVDAFNLAHPIAEPDLVNAVGNWPTFAPAAIDAGARAIFGFPMIAGPVRVGALTLYRDRPGMLSKEQSAWAAIVAAMAARKVLTLQSAAAPGQLAVEFIPTVQSRDVVYQATGMVSIQLGISVGQALIRLRGHAFANDCALTSLANDVVARRVRFDEDGRENGRPLISN